MTLAPEQSTADIASTGLAALRARLAEEMAMLNLPARPWVQPWEGEAAPDADVLVIGAGMLGLCATAALRLHGVNSVLCLDRAPAGEEGPWVTFARMNTLRTAKTATGPALGLPSLTFRAWFVAQYGAAWDALDKIPRAQWMDYLNWYRAVLDLPVRNDSEVTGITPREDGLFDVSVRG
ncbi:FAD/NAD(P)-binding protein, partial [Kozakia baliensis]